MDIFSFFNSPDVAEHCRNIGHTLNAFESAVMISQCYIKTFDEKLAAYRAIINEYPDMEVPKTHLNESHVPSFHKALEQIIGYEEQKLRNFLECESGAVYQVMRKHRNYHYDEYDTELFSTYEKAQAHALESVKLSEELGLKGEVHYMRIRKNYIDSDNYYSAKLSKLGDIMELEGYVFPAETKDPSMLLDCYIDMPVPFKKGDLVEDGADSGFVGNLFVLQTLSCDSPQHASWVMYNDTSDMIAYVYYLNDDQVCCEHIDFYPNLRYCRRELEGEERILKFVSLYMQEKICLCELLGVQRFLLADKIRDEELGIAIKWNTNLDEDLKKLLSK